MTSMRKEPLKIGERCWFVGHKYEPKYNFTQKPDLSEASEFGYDVDRAVIEGLIIDESLTDVTVHTGTETHELRREGVTRRPPTGISAERVPLSDSDKRKLADKYPDAW